MWGHCSDVCCQPLRKLIASDFARGKRQHQLLLFISCCFDFCAVKRQEHFHCRVTGSLIPVNEGMSLNDRKTQRGSFV